MPFDTVLGDQIRKRLKFQPGLSERQLFGELGFLLDGSLCVGVWKESLLARLWPGSEEVLRHPAVQPFDIPRRPMAGWVLVEPSGASRNEDLRRWSDPCVNYAVTLPRKQQTGRTAMRRTRRGSSHRETLDTIVCLSPAW